MSRFFDYIFYLIYTFYKKEKGSASSSAGIVGGLQAFNVISFYFLYLVLFAPYAGISKMYFILVLLVFQVTTYIRYIYREDNSVEDIKKRWQDLSESSKTRIRLWLFIYILISVVSFFGLAIYLGESKK
jgi:hypothetical protein